MTERQSAIGNRKSARHWSAGYVGLPWLDKGRTRDGVDCYGLVRLVYADGLDISLPSYAEAYACVAERAEIAAAIAGHAPGGPWHSVEPGTEEAFDVVVFRCGGLASHMGLVIGGERMLHIEQARHYSCIEPYMSRRWLLRLAGFYRHAQA